MQQQVAQQAVSIEQFVEGLHQLKEPDFRDGPAVREHLKRARVAPASLERYLFWDKQHYTRNLIDKTPLYELIAICWEVGQGSSIHNHHQQNCWMAVPIGRLLVQNYRVLSQDIQGGQCCIEPSDIVEMNPTEPMQVDRQEPVHRVYNPREFGARAVSLHIYSLPFSTCVVYAQEQGTCGEIELTYTSEYGVKNY